MRYAQIIYNKIVSLLESDLPNLSDYTDPMECIKDLWQAYNDQYFNGQLEPPAFRWMKATQKLRTLAHFSYKYNRGKNTTFDHTLSFSKKLPRNEQVLRDTLIHEMCHQAVVEIDNLYGEQHGPAWKKWARSCGIDASATTHADIPKTHSEEEYEREKAERAEKLRDEIEDVMWDDRQPLAKVENGEFIAYPSRDNGTIVAALGVVGKAPKTGKYVTVFSRRQNNIYSVKINKNFIYSVRPRELEILKERIPPELIEDIVEYANEKSALGRYAISQRIMQRVQEGYSRSSRLVSNIHRLLEASAI